MSDTGSTRTEPTASRSDFIPSPAGAAQRPYSGVSERVGLEQLSRIEEKTARIEEKFARSEALLLRVEATFEESVANFGGLARQAEVAAIDARVRGIPGYGALLFVGLLSALIGAALALAALKYGVPGFLSPVLTAPTAPP